MNTTDNIDELALQIYSKHQAAIDLIIKAKPALEARAWDVIDGAIAQHAPKLKPDHHGKSVPPVLFRGAGGHTGAQGRQWLDEIEPHSPFPSQVRHRQVGAAHRPGPGRDTPARLRSHTEEDGMAGVPVRRASKLSKSWHVVYSVPILSKSGSSAPDYENGQSYVEQAITNFYANHYPHLIEALREELA